MLTLYDFVRESNTIEGIIREPTNNEIVAHEDILSRTKLARDDIEIFVSVIASVSIRNKIGMNVSVGNHYPPRGGTEILRLFDDLLVRVNDLGMNSYECHIEYEKLHPFMDGNGRSGRVIWAWQLMQESKDPFSLPFLHRFYYQSLENSR